MKRDLKRDIVKKRISLRLQLSSTRLTCRLSTWCRMLYLATSILDRC